jgi:phosphoribosylamine--glycine ligase
MMGKRVLVVGSGGREHALALALLRSASVSSVHVAPGNGGTDLGALPDGKELRNCALEPVQAAHELRPDLVVVGPEVPLCEGLVDRLGDAGFLAYGPSKAAAQLEGSKAFMKEFATRHDINTSPYRVVRKLEELDAALAAFATPPVVKADGLCAGKGVVVADSHEEAHDAARSMLTGEAFGAAGQCVVLEARLQGAEASIHAICDGERALVLPAAQDHKRIFAGDLGPNTGGMGTYAPAPLVTSDLERQIRDEIILPVVRGMKAEGMPFKGTLFAGLMIDQGVPQLLEINVRFGDPETQSLLSVMQGDWAEVFTAAAKGALVGEPLVRTARHAVCVVLAAHGYPGQVRSGDAITGLDRATALAGVNVYHAGTAKQGDQIVTKGGRVLGVTAVGDDLRQAQALAYRAVDQISFAGMQYRKDIGHRALS